MKVEELAMMKKLEKDVVQGRTGVAMGSQKPNGPGEVPPHQYQVPSYEAQEEQPTDINAFNGKGPGGGQNAKGKSKGKGKGKDQNGGKSKGKGKGGKNQQQQGSSQGFTGCHRCGGPHYVRDCPKPAPQPNAASLDPCPAGAVIQLCKLTMSEEDPTSKKVGSSDAPSLGDNGVRTTTCLARSARTSAMRDRPR